MPISKRMVSTKYHEGAIIHHGHVSLGCLVFVREKYACLVHRFEKFNRILTPGLNFKIPFIEKIAFTHDLRE